MTPPKTHMERMGFRDPELGSPAHDALVLWMQKHAPRWLAGHTQPPPDRWSESRQEALEEVEKTLAQKRSEAENRRSELANSQQRLKAPDAPSWLEDQLKRAAEDLAREEEHIRLLADFRIAPRPPECRPTYHTELEHMLGNRRAFIDLVVTVTYPHYRRARPPYAPSAWIAKPPVLPSIEAGTTRRIAAFEAKLAIPSLGELLRQLRFYQNSWPDYAAAAEDPAPDGRPVHRVLYVVVSPDTRYRPQIEEQGFRFWEVRE